MSYSYAINFKQIEANEVFQFFNTLKKACTNNLFEIAKNYWIMCPFIDHRYPYPESLAALTQEQKDAGMNWIQSDLLHFRCFYHPEFKLLGMSGIPDVLEYLFDATVVFQNHSDNDYAVDMYGGIKAFEDIFDKWMNIQDETLKHEFAQRNPNSAAFDRYIESNWLNDPNNQDEIKSVIDYYKRTYCYDEIWNNFRKFFYDQDESIYISIYARYSDSQQMKLLLKHCIDCAINGRDEFLGLN